jgi:O-antigen/teichoic acid export membrane protein
MYMSVLKAYERMHYIALQQLAGAAVAVACAAAALMLRASLFALVGSMFVGQLIETSVGWQIVSTRFSIGKIYGWHSEFQWSLLSASLPIGLTIALQALNLRLDVLALGIFGNKLELGRFQAAAWFLVGTFLCVSLLLNVVFPKLSRLLQNPGDRSRIYVDSLIKNGSLLSMAASFVVWVGAPWILRWIYGPSLATAVILLRTLALALPFMFLNTMMSYVFIAARLRAVYLGTLAWGVALGSLLAVVFALRYGATGVAVADVIREFAMTCAFLFHLKRNHVGQEAGQGLLKAYLGSATLALVLTVVAYAVRPVAEWRTVLELLLLGGTLLVVGPPRRMELALLMDETP